MVKTRYTGLDPNHMAWVGPRGPDGQEIPVSLVYDQVKIAAKFSQQDCKLDNLLEGIEEEEVFESKWWCTLSTNFISSRIVKWLSWQTFRFYLQNPRFWSVSGYLNHLKTPRRVRKLGGPVIVA